MTCGIRGRKAYVGNGASFAMLLLLLLLRLQQQQQLMLQAFQPPRRPP